ncbi:MAG: prephenate dehydrogenase/arogenate dehydrogenase family protein [Velocimicrobium sp.]
MLQSITIGFIGFGLIGGSIARALRDANPNCIMVAYNYHDSSNQSLQDAREDGVLDYVDNNLMTHFSECDIIFLCAPVLENIKYLSKLKGMIKSTCLITDVGSVKGTIDLSVKELGLKKNFIGGHPMAGSERTGYHNSSSYLLENAFYILTPNEDTPTNLIELMLQIVTDVHAIPVMLDCKRHDDIVAAISHVPHIIASSLVHLVETNDDNSNQMLTLAAGGFKDITRIASSSPTMWQNICLTNRKSILKFLQLYQSSLEQITVAIETMDEDALYDYFNSAKNYRNSIPGQTGGIFDRSFEIYLDIMDETGAIASIATQLATHSISIKNIGIIHNREFAEGVLRIELYNQTSYEEGLALLKKQNYTIYER